jgi:hypothetical protein
MELVIDEDKRRLVCDCGNDDLEELEYIRLLPIVQQFVGEMKQNTDPADATAAFVELTYSIDEHSNLPEIRTDFEMIRCKQCRRIHPVPDKLYIYDRG